MFFLRLIIKEATQKFNFRPTGLLWLLLFSLADMCPGNCYLKRKKNYAFISLLHYHCLLTRKSQSEFLKSMVPSAGNLQYCFILHYNFSNKLRGVYVGYPFKAFHCLSVGTDKNKHYEHKYETIVGMPDPKYFCIFIKMTHAIKNKNLTCSNGFPNCYASHLSVSFFNSSSTLLPIK